MSIASFMLNEGIDGEIYTFDDYMNSLDDRMHDFDDWDYDHEIYNYYNENDAEIDAYEKYQNTFFYRSNKWGKNILSEVYGTINNIYAKIKIVKYMYMYFNYDPDDHQVLFNYSLGEALRNKIKNKTELKKKTPLFLCINNKIKYLRDHDLMAVEDSYFTCTESSCAERFLPCGDEIISYSPSNCQCNYEIKITHEFFKNNFEKNDITSSCKVSSLENISKITILSQTNYSKLFDLTNISTKDICKNGGSIYI